MYKDQERPRPPAARWLQPDPAPFWATRLFRWNLILCAFILSVAAVWMVVIEPKLNEEARLEALKESSAAKYVPRDPASKEPREVRFDGMLDSVKDDVDIRLRDEPYRYLVKYLAHVDPARLGAQAKSVDYKTIMERPEEVRGLTVRLNLQFWAAPDGPVRLDPPVGGVETITRAYFALPDAPKEVYFVDFVEPPPDIAKETPVIVDAVFLRRLKYERSDRPEFHQAPLFVARHVAKVQPAKAPTTYRFKWVVAILGLGLFGFLTYLTVKGWMTAHSGGPVPRRLS